MNRILLHRLLFAAFAVTAFAAPHRGQAAPVQNDLSIRKMAPSASTFQIWVYRNGQAIPVPESALPRERIPALAASLRVGGSIHSKPPAQKGDFLITLTSDMGLADPKRAGTTITAQFEYVSSTGDLGSGTEWYRAPLAFRRNMLALRKALPRYWFVPMARRAPAYDATPVVIVDPRTIVAPGVIAGRRLTKAQAIQAALAFRKKIGQPASSAQVASARFPAPPEFDFEPDYYWRPRWSVKFSDGAEIEIVDATGSVSSYQHFTPMDETLKHGTPLSRERLLGLARTVLAATGERGELAPPRIQIDSMTASRRPDVAWVEWRRTFHGIPYRSGAVRMDLHPYTGALVLLHVAFSTPPPPPVVERVTKDQALATAREFLSRKSGTEPNYTKALKSAVIRSAHREVVEELPPSQRRLVDHQTPGKPRLAWTCVFTFDRGVAAVSVDLATGKVIADEVGEAMGMPHRAPPARACHELLTIRRLACTSIRHAKATKCRVASVCGRRS